MDQIVESDTVKGKNDKINTPLILGVANGELTRERDCAEYGLPGSHK